MLFLAWFPEVLVSSSCYSQSIIPENTQPFSCTHHLFVEPPERSKQVKFEKLATFLRGMRLSVKQGTGNRGTEEERENPEHEKPESVKPGT